MPDILLVGSLFSLVKMGKLTTALACCVGLVLVGQAAAQSTPIPVVGVKTGINVRTGQRPARQNINQIYALAGPEWDLYILALSAFQEVNETDPLSYFAISGIHGIPHSTWNGVGQVPGGPEGRGYCPHNELLFPSWHRPYLALFEQALVSHAVRIADQYHSSQAPAYKAAAQTLRLPYWDWGLQAKLPTAATLVNITVNAPEGSRTLRNPLYSYRFQRLSVLSQFGGDLSKTPETVRCGASGSNNATESDLGMSAVARNLASDVYDVFIRTSRYETMAFLSSEGPSFEAPHNLVHMTAGCGGTLGYVDWSAFDPLFMLHHVNVDRYFAMWQAINYENAMFATVGTTQGMLGTAEGANITAESPLKPFYSNNFTFHTSASAISTRAFGYTYPEIDDWSKSPEELAGYVRSQVNILYDRSRDSGSTRRRDTRARHGSRYGDPKRYYTAEVEVNRSDIPLPSTVNLVINGTVVGRVALLSMPTTGIASASVTLKDIKMGAKDIDRVSPDDAVEYLQENIEFEIRLNDGSLADIEIPPSLKLEVQDMSFKPASNSTVFPSLGSSRRWPVPARRSKGYGY